jgi:hypothetical protein
LPLCFTYWATSALQLLDVHQIATTLANAARWPLP